MSEPGDDRVVLTMNGGSSSLKGSVVRCADGRRLLRASVSSVGGARPELALEREEGEAETVAVRAPDHARATDALLGRLADDGLLARVEAVGHRIVHGGPHGDRPRRVTPELVRALRSFAPLDPVHARASLAILEETERRLPAVPHVACFDTSFHRGLPRAARLLALPRELEAAGLVRYGFHGLSYTFLMEELARVAGAEAARGRVVLAHLGAGASLAAVRAGRCVDTTMGFTPASGIPMATRSGDLDPGALVWLLRERGLDADALDDLVNRRSGLLGVSGTSGDMRALLAAEAEDPRAAEAVELFCHRTRQAVGALAATLGGLDALVFSGGIGARSAAIRARVSRGLEHLGLTLDARRNEAGEGRISAAQSRCAVWALATDEESVLARETLAALQRTEPAEERR